MQRLSKAFRETYPTIIPSGLLPEGGCSCEGSIDVTEHAVHNLGEVEVYQVCAVFKSGCTALAGSGGGQSPPAASAAVNSVLRPQRARPKA